MASGRGYSSTPGSQSFRTPTPGSSRSATPSIKKKKPECPECGSRKLRKRDGQVFCEEGHIQQGIREETNEDEGITGTKARHTKKKKYKVGSVYSRRDSTKQNQYSEIEKRYLHFKCNQRILYRQIEALLREWPHLATSPVYGCGGDSDQEKGEKQRVQEDDDEEEEEDEDLPDQDDENAKEKKKKPTYKEIFKAITRDVWGIFILNLTEMEAISLFLKGEEEPANLDGSEHFPFGTGLTSSSAASPAASQIHGSQAGSTSDPMDLPIIDEEQELLEQFRDPDMDEEPVRNEEEVGENETPEPQGKKKRGRPKKKKEDDDRSKSPADLLRETDRFKSMDPFDLDFTIAALYYSLLIARVPVILGDLLELFKTNRLPYVYASQNLPFRMVEPFDDRRRRSYFERQDVPSFEKLQPTLRLMGEILFTSEIHLPELNSAPVLWAAVQRLALPPTIYTSARNLIPAIKLDLKTPFVRQSQGRVPNQARCLHLMALVVVVVKMRCGLDGEKRYEPLPQRNGFPIPAPAGVPDLQLWLRHLEKAEEAYKKDKAYVQEEEINLMDMMSLDSNSQIDALIDHSERQLLPENYESTQKLYDNSRRREDALSLLDSTTSTNLDSTSATTSDLPSTMKTRQSHVISQLGPLYRNLHSVELGLETIPISRDSLLAGEAYQIYDTADVLGVEHVDYQRVVRKASRAFGVEPFELIKCIEEIETQLSILNRHQTA